ncbi:MAG: methyltransferase domain-containing protein, partial [Methylobacter sp.]
MKFTGERYIPAEQGRIRLEHYHRYATALDVVKQKDVLDVACGEGYGSFFMAGVARSVVGVDISDEAIQHASATYTKSNLAFRQGSAIALDFAEASFDVVVSFETIEHLAEQAQMLAEIKRVLRPDGLLVISSPNRPVYSEESGEHNEFHVKELDFKEFDELLKTQFQTIKYFGQRLLMGSVIQPLKGRRGQFRAWHDDGNDLKPNAGQLVDPVYFVAVCGASNVDLPSIDMSVVYPDTLDLVKHYVGFAKWAQTLEQNVEERDGHIANLTQTVIERDGQVANLTQTVIERDGQVANLNQTVIKRDGQIGNLNQALAERERRSTDRLAALAVKMGQETFERDEKIASLKQTMTERDGQIARLNQAVVVCDEQIASLGQTVMERDRQIASLGQTVMKCENRILLFTREADAKRLDMEKIENELRKFDRPSYLIKILLSQLIRRSRMFNRSLIERLVPSRRARRMLVEQAELINSGNVFISSWYLEQNPDVAEAGLNPLAHYLSEGAAEGRNPNPLFDSRWYMEQNPD